MSDFEDPELRLPSGQEKSEEDIFREEVKSFRTDVVERMQQLGANAENAWLFFSRYQPVGDYPLLPETSEVSTVIIKRTIPMGTNSDESTALNVRIVETEMIKVAGGIEHVIQDVMIDELDEVHYMLDVIFVPHVITREDGTHEENSVGEAREKVQEENPPYVPLLHIDEGKLKYYYHRPTEEVTHPAVGPREGGCAMPFGDYESLTDEFHNLDRIKEMFDQVRNSQYDYQGTFPRD